MIASDPTANVPLGLICRTLPNRLSPACPMQLHTTNDVNAGSSQSANKTVTHNDSFSPKNYLMSGGYRAAARDRDEQLLQLNRAAMKACALQALAEASMTSLISIVIPAPAGLTQRQFCSCKRISQN